MEKFDIDKTSKMAELVLKLLGCLAAIIAVVTNVFKFKKWYGYFKKFEEETIE